MAASDLLERIKVASQELYQDVQNVVDEAGVILLGLAAVGILAQAIVNQLKDVVRPFYFRFRIRRQLLGVYSSQVVFEVESFMFAAATGNKRAFYKQDLEGIFASIGRVKNLVLMNPDTEESERFLFSWADPKWYPTDFRKQYRDDVEALIEAVREDTGEDANGEQKKARAAAIDAAKKPVNAALDAQLLGLRIRIQHDWARNRRWAATVVAVVLVCVFLSGTGSPWPAFVFALVGGFLAPFSHDLLKSLRAAKIK